MSNDHERQIPIWFFIGITLLVYGVIISVWGMVSWSDPEKMKMAMSQVHADVWWGAGMAILGGFYTVRFRPGKADAAEAAPPAGDTPKA